MLRKTCWGDPEELEELESALGRTGDAGLTTGTWAMLHTMTETMFPFDGTCVDTEECWLLFGC